MTQGTLATVAVFANGVGAIVSLALWLAWGQHPALAWLGVVWSAVFWTLVYFHLVELARVARRR